MIRIGKGNTIPMDLFDKVTLFMPCVFFGGVLVLFFV
jgi:hypothetical protein